MESKMVEEKKRVFDVTYIKTNHFYTHVMVSSFDVMDVTWLHQQRTLVVNVFEY
jgi:hypothetical protein